MDKPLHLISLIAAAAWIARGSPALALSVPVDPESATIVNLASGQVIEVPPIAQPGDGVQRHVPVRANPESERPGGTPAPSSESRALGSPGAVKPGVRAAGSPGYGSSPRSEQGASWLGHWTVRTAAGLALLGAMLWALKWAGRRFGAGLGLAAQLGPAGRAPQGLLEVLGRYPVSRGHTLVLLKLDRRVLLLGQGPTGFTTLSELTDADDVASVLMKAADAEGVSMSRRFSELLRGIEKDASFMESSEADPAPVSPRVAMRLAVGAGAASAAGGAA